MTRKGKEKDASKPDRATWTPEMEKLLIKALLVEIQNGRKAENGHGMTKEGWQNAHTAFNKHSKQPLELMQIKNKANALKKEFAVFSAIKESGEFTWDNDTGTPSATNEVWDRYVETNPIAKKYRGRSLSNFTLLSQLVSTTPITGDHTLTLTPESLSHPTPTTVGTSITTGHKRSHESDDEDSNDDSDKFEEAEEQPTSGSEAEAEEAEVPVHSSTPTLKDLNTSPKPSTAPHPSLKRLKRGYAADSQAHNLAIANALTTITQTLGLTTPSSQQLPPSSTSPASFSPSASVSTFDIHRAPVDNVQSAIATLQNDYDKKMSVEDLVACLSIFESELKAKMFVAMKKGLVRDAWLMKEIRVYRERGGDL